MPNYIIMQGGKPTYVQAVPFNGLLWNPDTSLPLIDTRKLAALPQQEQAHVRALLANPPKRTLGDLWEMAKRLACTQFTDRAQFAIANEAMRQEFFPVASIRKDPVVQKCSVREPLSAPSSIRAKKTVEPLYLPLPYKLAMRNYAFGPDDIKELCASMPLLVKTGRFSLLSEMAGAGLIDKALWKPTALEEKPIDPVTLAKDWYSLNPAAVATLNHMVAFFGGADRFFDFAARRTTWRQGSRKQAFKKEITWLGSLGAPESAMTSAAAWRGLFEKQMAHPYAPDGDAKKAAAKDIVQIYGRMDKIENYASRKGIVIEGHCPKRLLAIGNTSPYAQESDHPQLAALCHERFFPESSFREGVKALKAASKEDLIPDVYIDGIHFGRPDLEVVKLAKTDPMNLVAGDDASVCTHIGKDEKTKRELAIATVTNPAVGTYLIREKAGKRALSMTIAGLSVPRADGNYSLVMNAWSVLDPNTPGYAKIIERSPDRLTLDGDQAQIILDRMTAQVKAADPNITDVFIGARGASLPYPVLGAKDKLYPRTREAKLQGWDVRNVYHLDAQLGPAIEAAPHQRQMAASMPALTPGQATG